MIDFLINNAWVLWLSLVLIFLVIEMFTLEFTALMLGVASLGGVLLSLLAIPFWLQVIIVAVLSLLLILFLRPSLLHWLKRDSDPTKSNVDALIGLGGVVETTIPRDGVGTVKLTNGETWTARFDPEQTPLEIIERGQEIVVAAVSGARVIVHTEGAS
ncbi:NfeD family protein [Lysinibacter sp. HNR]|uniref:NfeD family protein n=1 Tax=Lysinibacter sp. HNR TaxID=3031408 RepID=UPI002434DB37|nr:NfeD family protein [Lysinibacter sp. HNR]WGD36227.1 NfeD family protein [Lysinibacter sp. HNR]